MKKKTKTKSNLAYAIFRIAKTAIIMILTILSVLIVWMIFISSFSNPQFTIYKEECRNETDYSKFYGYLDCITWGLHYVRDKDFNASSYIDKCKDEWKFEEKICEQKEVEEIDIIGKNLPLAHMYCLNGSENIKSCIAIISKKDLTLEWLDENCELARCTPCEDLNCKNQKCDLYSCGEDYLVEVK